MRDIIDPHMSGDDAELLGLLKSEETEAATYFSSELAQTQADAMDRYHARKYGDEVDGRSQVVTHDIEDMLNWIMPSLMRTFEPSDELITCDDDSLDDGAEILKSTSQYLRHVFFNQIGPSPKFCSSEVLNQPLSGLGHRIGARIEGLALELC